MQPNALIDPLARKDPSGNADDIRYDIKGGVATIMLDRPKVYNSYSTGTLERLAILMRQASFDDRVGVIVLTGNGTRAFCTGGDVSEYATRYTQRPRDYWKYMGLFRTAVESILDSGKPTIARLNGMAIGGGNELHLACDLSIAAEHAQVGQVGVGVGSVACGGATQWLPIFVGDRRARAMLMLNERLNARTALAYGLVNQVVASVTRDGESVVDASPQEMDQAQRGQDGFAIDLGPLDQAVRNMSDRLLGMFPECLRYTKEQTNYWKRSSWDATVGHAREWLALHFANLEPHEGMTAFTEKRRPRVAELRQAIAEGGNSEFIHGAPSKSCPGCGATGLPDTFAHCGHCGVRL